MPKKPDLASLEDLKKNGLPCESYKLKDLQEVAKGANIQVKFTLKAQCQEINNHLKTVAQQPPKEPVAAPSKPAKSFSIADMFLNPAHSANKGVIQIYRKPEAELREKWMEWISKNMSDSFLLNHLDQIELTSDKQGRSNSIVFQAKLICPAKFGPYPFDYAQIVEHGWQNVALKIYRQYYYIDNGGTVEKQIYNALVNDMTANNTCSHFINLLASHKIAMNKLIPDAKRQITIRNKLGIVASEKDIQLTVLIMDLSNDSSTLEGLLEREKSIDASSAKIQQYLAIIFQILYTLQCCAMSGIKHNDLHFRNILVEKLKKPAIVHYNLKQDDEKIIKFETDYWVRIIDFDQASVYHPLVERNFRLDLHRFCSDHNICNYISENDHYDGYGFLFQILQIMKKKSNLITEWIRLFITEEAENFVKELGQVKLVGKANERKPKKVVVPKKPKADEPDTNAIMEWFHQERIHFGAQNVATTKLTEWYQERNLRFPTVSDLLVSIIHHPFAVEKGKKRVSHNIFTKVTMQDLNFDPFRLDHFYQLIHLRPITFREPMANPKTPHNYIPVNKLGAMKNTIKFSEAKVDSTISSAISFLDAQLTQLNVFEEKSILPIWEREMVLLKYDWQGTAKQLLYKYWETKNVHFLNTDLFIAALLLSCPMYYGMSNEMKQVITTENIEKFISDIWSTFNLVLPMTIPALNGV